MSDKSGLTEKDQNFTLRKSTSGVCVPVFLQTFNGKSFSNTENNFKTTIEILRRVKGARDKYMRREENSLNVLERACPGKHGEKILQGCMVSLSFA